MKHDRSLCHECFHVGLCDGQAAGDCDVMNLAEFKTTLDDRLKKLDDQFSTLNDVLDAKKEAFIEMYRTDPRISHDESISCFQTALEAFVPAQPKMDERSLREQLLLQQEIAAEAEEIRIKLAKTQREKANLEKRFCELQSSLSGAEKQNEELQSVLDSLELEKSNLARDKSNVSRLLQETQARLRDAESVKTEQTRRIKELERYKEDYINRESQNAEKRPAGIVKNKPINETKKIIVCDKFSDHKRVKISLPKRGFFKNKGWSVKCNSRLDKGYCFLNHPNIGKNEILKWSLRVPKTRGCIGMVIILE